MSQIILLMLLSSFSVLAQRPEKCLLPITLESFNSILRTTKEQYFPELNKEIIAVTTFRSDDYFLRAHPRIQTLVGNRFKRQYSVQLNLKLLDCPPPEDALVAILVHELEHVKDYIGWSSAKIAEHGFLYSTSMKVQVDYEKQTDRKVLEKGLHLGLAGYREWIYQWLSPEELLKKKKRYLTSEEILEHH